MRPTYFFSWPFSWGCSMGKAPMGWPFCDPSSRMGAAPHSGTPAVFQVAPPISHYDHHSHTHRSHTYRSHTHRSHTHTALSHTPLSHYDHQLRCLKKKWKEGSASSTSPRSPDHGTHSVTKGSVVTVGLGPGPPSRVQRAGRGCLKDGRCVLGAGEGRPSPQLRPIVKCDPVRSLGHSQTEQYKLIQKPPPQGMSTSSKWASASSTPETSLQ